MPRDLTPPLSDQALPIFRMLQSALPARLRPEAMALAGILAGLRDGTIAPADAQRSLLERDRVVDAINALAGQDIRTQDTLIDFGSDVSIGQISIGDMAGGNIVKFVVAAPDPDPYNVADLKNPYLGLSTFTYADSARYAGRDELIQYTVTRVGAPGGEHRLLFIIGDSGSGKSSFAQAGLLPALEAAYTARGLPACHVVLRPGPYPMAALADAARQINLPLEGAFSTLQQFISPAPPPDIPAHAVRLLVLDQFEELFTQSDPTQREMAFAILTQLPPFRALPLHVIVTLRIDYVPALYAYPLLYSQISRGVELRVMTVGELKEAIVRPLQQAYPRAGKRFEPALLQRLAEDAHGQAAYLPLLQVTLEDLWRRTMLIRANYDSLTDAISQRAELIYAFSDYDGARRQARSPEEQEQIIDTFLGLVEVSLDDESIRDIRRRRFASDLTQGDPGRIALIDDLAQARLLSKGLGRRRMSDGLDGDERHVDVDTVDIIHESLLLNWARLKEAVRVRRAALQQRARFEDALRQWFANQCEEAYLLDGVRLSEAEELLQHGDVATQSQEARMFYTRSLALRQRLQEHELEQVRLLAEARRQELEQAQALADEQERRILIEQERRKEQELFSLRLQRRAIFLAGALLIALLAATAAGFFGLEAQRSASLAEAQLRANYAERARLAINSQPELALALSIAAAPLTPADSQIPADRALYSSLSTIALTHIIQGPTRIRAARWLPDERRLVTAGDDPAVRIWDGRLGEQEQPWPADGSLYTVAPSPDGAMLLASDLQRVKVYSLGDGRSLALPEFTLKQVRSLIWSPSGERVLAIALQEKGAVWIWDMQAGKELRLQGVRAGGLRTLAWSRDGATIVFDDGQSLRAFDTLSGQPIGLITSATISPLALSWSPTDDRLLTAEADGLVRVWSARRDSEGLTLSQQQTFRAHTKAISVALWSPDGTLVLTASQDGGVAVWDMAVEPPRELQRFTTDSAVTFADWNPDGARFLTGDAAGRVRLWDLRQGAGLGPLLAAGGPAIMALAWGAGGVIASGDADGDIRLWDAMTFEQRGILPADVRGAWVLSLSWSHDGRRLAASYLNCRIVVWDAEAKQQIWQNDLPYWVRSLAWSDDDAQILTANGRAQPGRCVAPGLDDAPALRLWASADGAAAGAQPIDNPVLASARWLPDNRGVVSLARDGMVQQWDGFAGKEVWRAQVPYAGSAIPDPAGTPAIAAGADGALLLKNDTSEAFIFDRGGGQAHRLVGHSQAVTSLAWVPGGTGRTLTGGADGTLRLWDVSDPTAEQGVLLATYKAGSPIQAIVVSPDGREVISGASDGSLQRWLIDRDAVYRTLVERLCAMYQGDDARIGALVPEWAWPGCAAALRRQP